MRRRTYRNTAPIARRRQPVAIAAAAPRPMPLWIAVLLALAMAAAVLLPRLATAQLSLAIGGGEALGAALPA